jgi:phosphoglycolate phosphatase
MAVVFDLDGTLVDSAPDLLDALDFTLASIGCVPADRDAVRPLISLGARSMIAAGLQAGGMQNKNADELLATFLKYYRTNISRKSRAFPGVPDVLSELMRQKIKLGVCTNKREAMALQLIGDLEMGQYFNAITGVDTFRVSKPDPGHLLKTLEIMGAKKDGAFMVGDSETDILTARRAGIPVIAVSFGYSDIPVATFGPDYIIDRYEQLLEIVTGDKA